MASSKVDICNAGLIRLGVDTISSLSDNNQRARLCNNTYDILRRRLLRSHPWRFSIKRATLAVSSSSPVWGFTYQYPLPNDCLRVIPDTDLQGQKFQIEGRMLLTDWNTAKIKYIRDVQDEQDFDDLFCEVLSLDIAIANGRYLTQSEQIVQAIRGERDELLRDARSFDAQESTPEDVIDDVWLNARYTGPMGG